MTKWLTYYEGWEAAPLECPACGWRGTFNEGQVEYFEELMETYCPRCEKHPKLAMVLYPTVEETEANLDRLSPEERKWHEDRKAFLARLERECLKSARELPDLPPGDRPVIFTWGIAGEEGDKYTVIKDGKTEIWREPVQYEGADRFADILAILREKYAPRLVDVVPTERSLSWLYGDDFSADTKIEKARRRLRTGPPPRGPGHRGKKQAREKAAATASPPGSPPGRKPERDKDHDADGPPRDRESTGRGRVAFLGLRPDGKLDDEDVALFMKELFGHEEE